MPDVEAPIIGGQVQVSAAAQQLTLESHTIDARAWLLGPDGRRVTQIPLSSGSIGCDSGSVVRRSGSIVVLGDWTDPNLTPYGSRVQIQRGVRVAPDTVEWITLFTGPVWEEAQDGDDAGDTALTLALKDEFATIAADRFDANTSTNTAELVVDAITRLIHRTLPNATVYDTTGSTTLCGKLDLQKDPAAGIVKLAEAIGAECFTGRGWQEFLIRPVPLLADPPRWSVAAGEAGNLISAPRKRTRDQVYNRLVATGETNDATAGGTSTPPPSGEARITDATDPIYYDGPFGRITRFYSSPLLKDAAQCTSAAAALLERVRGRSVDVSFSTLVNPAVDGGDRFDSTLTDGTLMRNLVDSVNVPLGAADAQTLSARSVELPDESAAAA